jgi:hypothetical protein
VHSVSQEIPLMEPEGSSQYSQKPAIGPYPEPDKPNPHLKTLFPENTINIILSSTLGPSEWSLPFRLFRQNSVLLISRMPQACYMPRTSPHWFDHPNIIWRTVQLMNILMCNFIQPPVTSPLLSTSMLVLYACNLPTGKYRYLAKSSFLSPSFCRGT